jgi:nicotinamidase-related amidase
LVFRSPAVASLLQVRRINTLLITEAEADVCVLATTLEAVDLGFRVILAENALCSSSDDGYESLLGLYRGRFSEQIEIANAESCLSAWPQEAR